MSVLSDLVLTLRIVGPFAKLGILVLIIHYFLNFTIESIKRESRWAD